MLDESLLPTLLERDKDRKPVEIQPTEPEPRWPFARVAGRFASHFLTRFRHRITNRSDPDAEAKRLRETFEELGGLWIKIGQLLSLRTEVFSEAVCREPSRLQDLVTGFPLAGVAEAQTGRAAGRE